MFPRILRLVNYAIAILLVLAAGLFYWFVWRPLPQRSGTVEAPVDAAVSVAFDARGVPHIRAASLDDALFVQGYVTAQDRLWQMDALRRFTAGELSEVVGPAALDTDRESRRLRLRRIAEDAYTTLPAADRAAMAAYARGINAFIASHLNDLPVEFTLLGYQPRPWSVVDSLLVCIYMFRDLTTTWRDEMLKRNMLASGDPAKVQYLFPVRAGWESPPGSNAWALAGRHTASGKPLLSNDMHLEYSLPGIWYMVHLTAPEMDVSGVSLPGVPGVIVGHNQRIAWGITNLQFDVQDLYLEQIDEQSGRYVYEGQPAQARLEREIIRVKGATPAELGVWVTRHGPLFLTEAGARLTLRWTLAIHGIMQFPVLDIDRAQNWQQFTAALERFPGPGSNFVYADVDGNVGYHAAGKLPKRTGYAGDLPVDGASGKYDWDGFIPFDQLPAVFNPPSGIIDSANQDTFPADYPYPVNGQFAPPDRSVRIRKLLEAREGWKAQDLLAVQGDVYSAFGKFLAGNLVAAYQKRQAHNPSLDPAIVLLRGWNGQMDRNLAAPLIMALAYQQVRVAIAENAAPGQGAAYDYKLAQAVVEKLLRERPAGWFEDYDEMLLRALVDAVEEGRRMQGRDIRRWEYGAFLRIGVAHPITHQVPVVGKYFDIAPVPMSGWNTTVKQTTRTLAPSMRMDADLGDWDRSLLNGMTGQSGQILSSHYQDQWEDYYNLRSYPMQFRKVEARSAMTFQPAASHGNRP
jgi:penicillin G amidase